MIIFQGSSGSYFVKNIEGETIGVFKPKVTNSTQCIGTFISL